MKASASQSFSRAGFMKKLDRFHLAIEQAAAAIAVLLNDAKAYFHRQREDPSALENELQVLAAKALSSTPTN